MGSSPVNQAKASSSRASKTHRAHFGISGTLSVVAAVAVIFGLVGEGAGHRVGDVLAQEAQQLPHEDADRTENPQPAVPLILFHATPFRIGVWLPAL